MKKYEALDRLIMDSVGEKPKRFSEIFTRELRAECDRIRGTRDSFRVLDARLQAMRKKGVLRATTLGWIRVEGARHD